MELEDNVTKAFIRLKMLAINAHAFNRAQMERHEIGGVKKGGKSFKDIQC